MLVGGLVHSLFTSIFISLYFFLEGGALLVHLSFCLCIFVWVTQSYNFLSLEVPYSNKDNGYLGPEGLRRSY